ncbi:hypothetical protein Q5741_14745 [Paenibacillus sp. JX-17]|uniref:Uncharacterized protein n=1 Tax=Paenibacillus lacisoli TaxID=3064525 RepID=A0ABT9CEM5_9BACL|nr:hypothetical protein [Paenibacillus sp. JX-17]MDO7907666.1 hypothetical protein [Paenibacillus sp. JX-17]
MEYQPGIYGWFPLTQTGFDVLSILFVAVLLVGIVVMAIRFNRLDGRKMMFFGGELILLGFFFSSFSSFQLQFPSLSLVTVLIGVVVSMAGLFKRG